MLWIWLQLELYTELQRLVNKRSGHILTGLVPPSVCMWIVSMHRYTVSGGMGGMCSHTLQGSRRSHISRVVRWHLVRIAMTDHPSVGDVSVKMLKTLESCCGGVVPTVIPAPGSNAQLESWSHRTALTSWIYIGKQLTSCTYVVKGKAVPEYLWAKPWATFILNVDSTCPHLKRWAMNWAFILFMCLGEKGLDQDTNCPAKLLSALWKMCVVA